MQTLTTHDINGELVESHGREVMEIINPTNGEVIDRLTSADEDDAIRIANDTEYGQHAYVSGTDIERARRVASQIQASRVAINGLLDDQQAPFGGFKHSDVGREFGMFGIEAYLEPRAILES
jgi:aldehyde dehydrogenase (NAD+)